MSLKEVRSQNPSQRTVHTSQLLKATVKIIAAEELSNVNNCLLTGYNDIPGIINDDDDDDNWTGLDWTG